MAQLVKYPTAMWDTWVQSLIAGGSPREGKGYPLQYSGLENSMDYIVHGGHKELAMIEWFSLHFFTSSTMEFFPSWASAVIDLPLMGASQGSFSQLKLRYGTIDVEGVYDFLSSVSLQKNLKQWMDQCYSPQMDQCYSPMLKFSFI